MLQDDERVADASSDNASKFLRRTASHMSYDHNMCMSCLSFSSIMKPIVNRQREQGTSPCRHLYGASTSASGGASNLIFLRGATLPKMLHLLLKSCVGYKRNAGWEEIFIDPMLVRLVSKFVPLFGKT